MDFVGGGDLFTLIEAKRRLPESWARVYVAEAGAARRKGPTYFAAAP